MLQILQKSVAQVRRGVPMRVSNVVLILILVLTEDLRAIDIFSVLRHLVFFVNIGVNKVLWEGNHFGGTLSRPTDLLVPDLEHKVPRIGRQGPE